MKALGWVYIQQVLKKYFSKVKDKIVFSCISLLIRHLSGERFYRIGELKLSCKYGSTWALWIFYLILPWPPGSSGNVPLFSLTPLEYWFFSSNSVKWLANGFFESFFVESFSRALNVSNYSFSSLKNDIHLNVIWQTEEVYL